MEDTKLKIKSAEGRVFEVESSVIEKSEYLRDFIGSEESIPLSNIRAEVLEKVIEYCRHYRDEDPPEIEKPLKSAVLQDSVPSWDATFIELEHEIIFGLILAANFLNIKSLLDLSSAKIASLMKGKTPEEICRTFNIENDFTPEEQQQVQKENRWAEQD